MAINEFIRAEDGWFECLTCHFKTAHAVNIKRHMVKSHGHATYPEPPVLAEKWRLLLEASDEEE